MKPVTSERFAFFATTRDVEVAVTSYFLRDQSEPDDNRFVWAYQIRIQNNGSDMVQLISRHWIITDGLGRVEHVRGPGVVGEQPEIDPGQSFEYSSGCPLGTPSGMMVGTYQMVNGSGTEFEIEIPAFSLDSPFADQTLN
jgi:ApaG protein